MKRLFLLRHAKSSWGAPQLRDIDRPLNSRGEMAAPIIANYIKENNLTPDHIICSMAVRTRQTLALMAPAFENIPVLYDRTIYEASCDVLFQRIQACDDQYNTVLVIGHNPGMQSLAMALCGMGVTSDAHMNLMQKFPTAALACMDLRITHWADLAEECGTLTRFIRPRDLDDRLRPDPGSAFL